MLYLIHFNKEFTQVFIFVFQIILLNNHILHVINLNPEVQKHVLRY